MLLDTLATSLRNSNLEAFSSASAAPKSLAIIIMNYGKRNILDLFAKHGVDISTEQVRDLFTKMAYDILVENALEVALVNSDTGLTKEQAMTQLISESYGALLNENDARCALALKAIYQ